jgi:hypothetical protein
VFFEDRPPRFSLGGSPVCRLYAKLPVVMALVLRWSGLLILAGEVAGVAGWAAASKVAARALGARAGAASPTPWRRAHAAVSAVVSVTS